MANNNKNTSKKTRGTFVIGVPERVETSGSEDKEEQSQRSGDDSGEDRSRSPSPQVADQSLWTKAVAYMRYTNHVMEIKA